MKMMAMNQKRRKEVVTGVFQTWKERKEKELMKSWDKIMLLEN
jgi:hypothetical protein